jgi:hypothetical protein
MGHFAELNENNVVVRVLVTDNNLPNQGYDWLIETLGGTWIQTSYNTYGGVHSTGGTPLRKNYAGVGFTYDSELDAFIPLKPFDSWVLNEETCLWDAPIPKPEGNYRWDEDVLNWVEVQGE